MCYLTMNFPLILINLWKQNKEAYYIHLEFREEKKEKNGERILTKNMWSLDLSI